MATIPENRALALRPHILYMPRSYAALLISLSGVVGMGWQYPIAGLCLFLTGWGLGAAVTAKEPFAWELMARNLKLRPVLWS